MYGWYLITLVLFFLVILFFSLHFSFLRTTGKKHKRSVNIARTYVAMCMIFAIWTLFSSWISFYNDGSNNTFGIDSPTNAIPYLVSFVINAMLGMITLYFMNYTNVLIALSCFIFIAMIVVLWFADKLSSNIAKTGDNISQAGNAAAAAAAESPVAEIIKEIINFFTFGDFFRKVMTFVNFGTNWMEVNELYGWVQNMVDLIIFVVWLLQALIIKLPFILVFCVIWFLSGLMKLISLGLGLISSRNSPEPADAAPPVEAKSGFEKIMTKFNEKIKWCAYLCVFMLIIFIMYAFQGVMRDSPKSTLAFATTVLFIGLAYIRFFKFELFNKAFVGVVAALFILGIYLYNPNNLFSKMSGVNMFVIFMMFFGLLGMIFLSNKVTDDPENKLAELFKSYIWKIIFGIVGLGVSAVLIFFLVAGFTRMQTETPSVGIYILNILIIVGMLTIVFNTLDSNRTVRDSPFFKLFIAILLYIPCLLSDLADLLMSEYYKTKYLTLVIIVLEIIFAIVYWVLYPEVVKKVYTGGGEVLVNSPVSLNVERTVGYYRNLTGAIPFIDTANSKGNEAINAATTAANDAKVDDNSSRPAPVVSNKGAFADSTTDSKGVSFNTVSGLPMLDASGNPIILRDASGNYLVPQRVNTYSYGVSCWLYINPMPSQGSTTFTLLNYGNNPIVSYSPKTNELNVSVIANEDCSAATDTTASVYKNTNVPLQVWFNLVLNYTGGRLDIFLNSELVKTATNVVSCVRYDALTIGQTHGANAKICNLIYFKKPLDIITIHNMYNITKIENVPDIPKRDLFSI
jgi:hypothetical protein